MISNSLNILDLDNSLNVVLAPFLYSTHHEERVVVDPRISQGIFLVQRPSNVTARSPAALWALVASFCNPSCCYGLGWE
jgi:hypothetical protein